MPLETSKNTKFIKKGKKKEETRQENSPIQVRINDRLIVQRDNKDLLDIQDAIKTSEKSSKRRGREERLKSTNKFSTSLYDKENGHPYHDSCKDKNSIKYIKRKEIVTSSTENEGGLNTNGSFGTVKQNNIKESLSLQAKNDSNYTRILKAELDIDDEYISKRQRLSNNIQS